MRAKEDYLIGINFSRLLSIIYGRKVAKEINEEKASISIGRVMTCVLGMVVSREREIRNFVKTKYYKIIGEFGNENGAFKAEWKVNEKSKMFESPKLYNESGFKKEDDAKQFIASLAGKKATITELKKSKQKENAPLLFNLAEIQNECTKRFKIKPDETLEIIQNLYEKKLVTYPRTDARVLSYIQKSMELPDFSGSIVPVKILNCILKNASEEGNISLAIIDKMIFAKFSNYEFSSKLLDGQFPNYQKVIPEHQNFSFTVNKNDLDSALKSVGIMLASSIIL